MVHIEELDHKGYSSLSLATQPTSANFANAAADVDPSVANIGDGTFKMGLNTSFVKIARTVSESITVKFSFTNENGTDPYALLSDAEAAAKFKIYWDQNINDSWTIGTAVRPDPSTKPGQWEIPITIGSIGTTYAFSDYLVIRHKQSALERTIHFYAVEQFRFRSEPIIEPVLVAGNQYVGPDADPNPQPVYALSFTLSQSLEEDLLPISVWIASITMEPYSTGEGNYTSRTTTFGVTVEPTEGYFTSSALGTQWNYRGDSWNYWYEYKLLSYPPDGKVTIYLQDIRSSYFTASRQNLGLQLELDNLATGEEVTLFAPHSIVENRITHEFTLDPDKDYVKVGVADFMIETGGSNWGWDPATLKVRYPSGSTTVDAPLVPIEENNVQVTETKAISGASRTFYMFYAEMPVATGSFRVIRNASGDQRQFGAADASTSDFRNAYIYVDGSGNQAYYE